MKRSAAARCTAWPPPTEPVKATKAMRGSAMTRADLLVVEVQELEHAVGQAGGLERFGVALGDERRLLRHLEDHGVAGEQRGHHRVHRGEPRIVPRRDDEHDAERLAADEALEACLSARRDRSASAASAMPAMYSARSLEAAPDLVRACGRSAGPSAASARRRARRRARRTSRPCAGRSRRARRPATRRHAFCAATARAERGFDRCAKREARARAYTEPSIGLIVRDAHSGVT